MRSKLWWFSSAALIWIAVAFVALFAMVIKSLDFLFVAQDDAAVMLAGATWTCMAAGGISLIAWVIALLRRPGRSRVHGVFADMAAQGAFVAFGGLLTCLYAVSAPAALVVAPFALLLMSRLACYEDERGWTRPGLIGLSTLTSLFIILIVNL